MKLSSAKKMHLVQHILKKKTSSRTSKKVKMMAQAAKLEIKWQQLYKKNAHIQPNAYSMSETSYEEKTPLYHKSYGWGFILKIKNNRLEVLFEEGIKSLISGKV